MKNTRIFKKVGFVLLVLAAALNSCKKSNTSTNTAQAITSGVWKPTKIEYQQKDGTWINDPDAQDMDVITISFNSNNTYVSTDDGYSNTGSWQQIIHN